MLKLGLLQGVWGFRAFRVSFDRTHAAQFLKEAPKAQRTMSEVVWFRV